MGLLEQPELDLDDKSFDELVQEARTLISRYCPEWTDHNIHDPGITFIELFAWLAEMQIYQLDRITENNYRKFLELVNIFPGTQKPAKVDVTFEPKGAGLVHETVTAGEKIVALVDGEQMVFEVELDTVLIPSTIRKVTTRTGSRTIDNTEANATEHVYFAAFGEHPSPGAELTLDFEPELPPGEIQLTFNLFEDDLTLPGRHGAESTDINPSVILEWQFHRNGKWERFAVRSDTTQSLTGSGRVTLELPSGNSGDVKSIRCRIAEGRYEIPPMVECILINTVPVIQVETSRDVPLGESTGMPGQTLSIGKKPVMARRVFEAQRFLPGDIIDWQLLLGRIKSHASETPEKRIWDRLASSIRSRIKDWDGAHMPDPAMKSSVLGALNGMLGDTTLYDETAFSKVRMLDSASLLIRRMDILNEAGVRSLNRYLIQAAFPDAISPGRPVIQVGDGTLWETWTEVRDFESSGPSDAHYVLDAGAGEITFGNGLNGKIPGKDAVIRAHFFQTTLGRRGNLRQGVTFRFETQELMDKVIGKNLRDAAGGEDAESVEDAKGRARRDLRTVYRAITPKDYEQLALDTPGLRVRRAKAVENYHPGYPCVEFPGSVTVVVVPYARKGDATPMPGNGFLKTVFDHLDTHRLITTDLHVIKPEYISISVKCSIKRSQKEVEKRVIDRINRFLDPLSGGEEGNYGDKGKGWPFGRAVYPSEIYQIIDEVEGVDYVTRVTIAAGGGRDSGEPVKIPEYGLVYPGEHQITFI